MRSNKQYKNWWIDAALLVGYLLCFYLDLTGVVVHQWLGVGITLLAAIHFWLHLDWVKAVTQRFFNKTGSRNRWYYLVDLLIMLGFVVIAETGVVISTWVNLDLNNYVAWLDIHTYASFAVLGMLVLKIGIHWRWVVNITRKIFGSNLQPGTQRGSTLVPVKAPVQIVVSDRRHFLAMMGVVGLGSLLAVSNVVTENTLRKVSAMADTTDTTTGGAQAAVTQGLVTPQANTVVTQAQTASGATLENPAAVIPTETATSTVTQEPTQDAPAAVAMCQVRCPNGCSFPGRCRRYTDSNGNGLCDLGECL